MDLLNHDVLHPGYLTPDCRAAPKLLTAGGPRYLGQPNTWTTAFQLALPPFPTHDGCCTFFRVFSILKKNEVLDAINPILRCGLKI